MDLGPSILDDKSPEALSQLRQEIDKVRDRNPFSKQFRTELERLWSAEPDESLQCPWALSMMVRQGDDSSDIVEDCAKRFGRHLEAYYIYWASGLYEDARRKIDECADVRAAIGNDCWYDGVKVSERSKLELCEQFSEHRLWGKSEPMLHLFWHADDLGRDISTCDDYRGLFLLGEPGTEKARLARIMHDLCHRTFFKTVKCSELKADPQGLFEQCHQGVTVLLTEIDDLPPEWQASLVKEFVASKKLDTLFIIDTSKQFDFHSTEIHNKLFPASNPGLQLHIPSLKQRRNDIPLLINKILLEYPRNQLDDVRHYVAERITENFMDAKPAGDMAWLREELRRWVEEFDPETLSSEREEKSRKQVAPPSTTVVTDVYAGEENVFILESTTFFVRYKGIEKRGLSNLTGMRTIEYLLTHPDTEIHVSDLKDHVDSGGRSVSDSTFDDYLKNQRLAKSDLTPVRMKNDGTEEAWTVEAIRREVKALQIKLESPETQPDQKIEFKQTLTIFRNYLLSVKKTGGDPDHAPVQTEKDRNALRGTHKTALEMLKKHHPALRDHLKSNITIGPSCYYDRPKNLRWSP